MKIVIINLGAFILLVVGALAVSKFIMSDESHPSDEVLVTRFREQRSSFEKLIEMYRTDKSVGRVGANFERAANFFEACKGNAAWNGEKVEVNSERLKEYRALFAELNIPAGIEGYCEKDSIHLYASTKGLAVTGSTKGYAFLKDTPVLLVDDLDSYWSADSQSFIAYKRIEGNWYLFLDYED